jgi:mannose-6-phosphate isomerase-like protein (cupin superfamily)
MKRVQKEEAVEFTNGPSCSGYEYSFEDSDLNISLVKVNGRYPEEGFAMNEVCKEAAYIVGGSGSLCVEGGERVEVSVGDAILLQPHEKYYWEGVALTLVMPCAPAFYSEQHKKIS